MTIKFLCPSGHRLKADPRDANRHVDCPVCRHEVIVPRLEDLEESSLQEEDSDFFANVSIEEGERIVSTARPQLPPTPANPSDAPLAEQTSSGSSPGLVQGYRPDQRRVESLKWLVFVLGLMVVFGAAPAVGHVNPVTAPGWARVAVLLAVLQACYLGWMLSAPDWSTIRVVMIVFGVTAVIYAVALAWIVVTPSDRSLPLGVDDVRNRAAQWCGCVLTLMLFGAYLCARSSSEWRRAERRETAARSRPNSSY